MAEVDEEHIEELDLSSAEVVTKYRMASDIVQTSLQGLLSRVRPGAKVLDLCGFGDSLIEAQVRGSSERGSMKKTHNHRETTLQKSRTRDIPL